MFMLLARLIFSFFSNLVGLFAAVYFVQGFQIKPDVMSFVLVAGILTLLNIFIRPILKFILSPIIFFTLGLGIFLVNALILYLLDFLSTSITISGPTALLYSTLIITAINILINFSAKRLYKSSE